jgi:hypothetical protein
MKRERTQNHDIFRVADSVSIVERKSGAVVAAFVIPCEETRKALLRLLSDPVKAATADEVAPPETGASETPVEKPKTTRKSSKKAAS